MQFSDKILNIAAKYWMNIIKDGKDHDNGDNSFASFMCKHLADNAAETIDADKLEKFRIAFLDECKKALAKYPHTSDLHLYCDYHPGFILADAAKAANIDENQFPWKAGIIVYPNAIIEHRPYRKMQFEDTIVYCETSYLQAKIESIKQCIEELKVRKVSKWFSEKDRTDYINDYTHDLAVFENLLKTIPDGFTRQDCVCS